MGKIYYVMGKSASGKDTIFQKLKEAHPELSGLVLYTTRPMRNGEREGVEYHFVDEDRIQEFQADGKLIEARTYHTVNGPWTYATVDDGQIDLKQNDYLVIGTLESYRQMKQYFGEDIPVPVYIYVEDGLRLERALARERQQKNPNYAELCRRYLADEEDFSKENLEKCGIVKKYENVDLDECLKEIQGDWKQQ